MKLGAPVMRALIGGLFVGHGTQKLFGWFGGPGLEGTTGMMEKLEMRPPRRQAVLVGAAEAGGGLLLALGALTPLATMMLTGSMTTAIRKVHGANGPWVDSARFPRAHGPAWAIASLAGGVAGSFAAGMPPFNQPAPETDDIARTNRFERSEQTVSATA
jgi:putative oxidoreductase